MTNICFSYPVHNQKYMKIGIIIVLTLQFPHIVKVLMSEYSEMSHYASTDHDLNCIAKPVVVCST